MRVGWEELFLGSGVQHEAGRRTFRLRMVPRPDATKTPVPSAAPGLGIGSSRRHIEGVYRGHIRVIRGIYWDNRREIETTM